MTSSIPRAELVLQMIIQLEIEDFTERRKVPRHGIAHERDHFPASGQATVIEHAAQRFLDNESLGQTSPRLLVHQFPCEMPLHVRLEARESADVSGNSVTHGTGAGAHGFRPRNRRVASAHRSHESGRVLK